jgi:hypothetical protein
MELMSWTDKLRKLGVRTNSDTPEQVQQAIKFGAEGIGLTRAEHMFFEGNRIDSVREMILADDDAGRAKALKKIKVFMKKDFIGIFKSLEGPPGHHPSSGSTSSRVHRHDGCRSKEGSLQEDWHERSSHHQAYSRSSRREPNAWSSWLPSRHQLSSCHRNAG